MDENKYEILPNELISNRKTLFLLNICPKRRMFDKLFSFMIMYWHDEKLIKRWKFTLRVNGIEIVCSNIGSI